MKNLPKVFIIIFIISLIGFLGLVSRAGSGDNTSGYAWSENIGWISFNSASDGSPVSYGVNIDFGTGNLSGYAWSENIGWISFNRADTGNPPAGPFNGGSGPIAQYDFDTDQLTGWFRVLAYSGGWDGWVKFYDATVDANGDWHGFAWSDMVVGWLSFNSAEGGGSAYKVTMIGGINRPPSASGLGVVKGDYSSSPAHYFSWTYSDPDSDTEGQFQFQVDNNSDFSSPKIDRTVTGTWSSGASNNQIVVVAVSPGSDQIGYNTPYYWRVTVWDAQGASSNWVQYSDPADADGDGNPLTFTTELHRYPSVDFTWAPQQPSQEENVLFTDQSTCYDISNNPTACVGWSWTFEDGNPASSNTQNSTIQFTSDGSKQVSLEVADVDGYTCQISKSVGVQAKLPGWEEILPW